MTQFRLRGGLSRSPPSHRGTNIIISHLAELLILFFSREDNHQCHFDDLTYFLFASTVQSGYKWTFASWLASEQWWDDYLYLSQKVQVWQSKTCDFKIKTKWSKTVNISQTTCTTKLKLVKCNKRSSSKLNKVHKHVM